MRQRGFISLLLLLFLTGICFDYAHSQTILVRGVKSLKPIDNVAIFNPAHTYTALTNVYGIADISTFPESDTLIFQHTAYETYAVHYAQISEAGFNIYLEKKSISLDEIIISDFLRNKIICSSNNKDFSE